MSAGTEEFCYTGSCPNYSNHSLTSIYFGNLIMSLFQAQCSIEGTYPPDRKGSLLDQYDFIVVGSGSGGSTVTYRLAQVEEWNILLIEAGGLPQVYNDIPLTQVHVDLEHDWNYRTEPQEGMCESFENGGCLWPRGKVLGGSTVLNSMVYIRGNRRDFDEWAEHGNEDWNYDSIFPFFLKSENMTIEEWINSPFHSVGGPLTLVDAVNHDFDPFIDFLYTGVTELSVPITDDLNKDVVRGFYYAPSTITTDGRRCHTAKAFLEPLANSTNLHLLINSQVTKVLISNNSAYGVEVSINGTLTEIYATKEVIISAGAINSPQILMLSGIGPADHLESIGISPILDLSVGENLQDHLIFWVIIALDPLPVPVRERNDELYQYLMHRENSFNTTGTCPVTGFLNVNDYEHDVPTIQFYTIYSPVNQTDGLAFNLEKYFILGDNKNRILEQNTKTDITVIMPALLKPYSRGNIKLRDSNPFSKPLIYANYMEDHRDVETMIGGIRFLENLIQTDSWSNRNASMVYLQFDKCESLEVASDEFWECTLRQAGTTVYHPVGTVKMGSDSDPEAVLDSNLNVRGLQNLRVIDASVMPIITSGNTNAPTIMIGEKGAWAILEDYNKTN